MKQTKEIFEEFISQKDKISCKELDEFFTGLKPVKIEEMIGEWQGGNLFTESKWWRLFFKNFIGFKWYGKKFLDSNNVQAQIWSFLGKIKFNIPGGTAFLRRLEFRDKVSTSMIYNYLPIVDNFRKVNDDTVMAIMEIKGKVSIYFYLKRI
ncbi:DUF4334 domain-containing protein [Candidatus Kuenenbacteria bacterium]|nr:DUF4334 domain-containing protein [Candidatus Kuenenbacteria bacterium]